MSTNDNSIRRTVMPPLSDDGVRRWGGAASDAAAASDDLAAVRHDLDVVINTLTNFIDELPDKIKQLVDLRMQASKNEMRALIAESMGTLRGELKGCLAGIRGSADPGARRKGEFKFAGEADNSDEPTDLPNWRTGRVVLN
jgi:hypothetical protein